MACSANLFLPISLYSLTPVSVFIYFVSLIFIMLGFSATNLLAICVFTSLLKRTPVGAPVAKER